MGTRDGGGGTEDKKKKDGQKRVALIKSCDDKSTTAPD